MEDKSNAIEPREKEKISPHLKSKFIGDALFEERRS